jgi:hypothetical protein
VASKFWAKVYIEILDDWNEETGTTENPGAIGWMLIVLGLARLLRCQQELNSMARSFGELRY